MCVLLRWLAAVVAGVAIFEGLDQLASNQTVVGWLPATASLPAISPFVTGAVAAWWAAPGAIPSLAAVVAAVWARIGVDRAIGALHGAHPPAEAEIILVAFGVAWSMTAVGGGVIVVLVRWILKRRAG